ncbi:hypothetical protein FD724_33615 (plasmid) [Nostoc sp. C057]|nr:hypothetical protein FD724_33615 [Nostoc sp. C057]
MEQMNLISPEIMAEISNGNSTKLPDNTRKMLQILASLNTPKELLASLLEIAEFSLQLVTLWTNILKQLFPALLGMGKLQYPLSLDQRPLGLPFL